MEWFSFYVILVSAMLNLEQFFAGKEVLLMDVISDVLLAIAADIISGVLLYFICKWLDRKDS